MRASTAAGARLGYAPCSSTQAIREGAPIIPAAPIGKGALRHYVRRPLRSGL
jgi:hypothetical protein